MSCDKNRVPENLIAESRNVDIVIMLWFYITSKPERKCMKEFVKTIPLATRKYIQIIKHLQCIKKILFLSKIDLWVLRRTVLMGGLFWAPKIQMFKPIENIIFTILCSIILFIWNHVYIQRLTNLCSK